MTDTQNTQDKLDALIAAAMHCKARRADPAYSYEGLEIAKAFAAIHNRVDEANELVADLQAELDEEHSDTAHKVYLASVEMNAAAIRYYQESKQ